MDRNSVDLDRQLGEWLRQVTITRAPGRVVEGVFARTSRTRQVRRWWPAGLPPSLRPEAPSFRLVVAAIAIVAVTVFAMTRLLPRPGVGTGPTQGPTSTPGPTPTLTPLPSPRATALDGAAATVMRLGGDTGPIDVIEAFDSIWVANIHANEVLRLDPVTGELIARIPAGTGPAWFAATDTGLWVTNQTGRGLVLIDPVSNTAVTTVGDAQPCGQPVLAFGSLWASACDSGAILRIDLADFADIEAARRFPSTSELFSTISAQGYRWLALADGRLLTGDAAGLAEVDPTTETVTDLGICCGDVIGSDGQTIWLDRGTEVVRMDPADGTIVATFGYPDAGSLSFVDGRAWLTVGGVGAIEIDLASNDVLRTIPVPGSLLFARETAGALWVTSFDTSELWRIEP